LHLFEGLLQVAGLLFNGAGQLCRAEYLLERVRT
jgi:hypothetical protein